MKVTPVGLNRMDSPMHYLPLDLTKQVAMTRGITSVGTVPLFPAHEYNQFINTLLARSAILIPLQPENQRTQKHLVKTQLALA